MAAVEPETLWIWQVVRQCLPPDYGPSDTAPRADLDLVAAGLLDSMAWVDIISRLEGVTGTKVRLEDDMPCTIATLVGLFGATPPAPRKADPSSATDNESEQLKCNATIAGWGYSTGSEQLAAAEIDRDFGLAAGTLEERTGIQTVARVGPREDQVSLARAACEKATAARLREVDLLIATSGTYAGFPSLAATLHAELLLQGTCAPVDVGGACVGLLYAFYVARMALLSGLHKTVLVVASEVHSNWLRPGKVEWEFGALFGDGACAFLVHSQPSDGLTQLVLGDFVFGCDPAFSGALRVSLSPDRELSLEFQGAPLAATAVSRMASIAEDLGMRCGIKTSEFSGYAIHQPNPRVVDILAKRIGAPSDRIPEVARTFGNLGSATCGVGLCQILSGQQVKHATHPLLMAAVGPGLLWAGATLH